MKDIKQRIQERFSTDREYTAGDISNWMRAAGMVVGESIAADLLMDLVEDGCLRVEVRSGIKCFRKAADGEHQSLRMTIKDAAERHGFSVAALRGGHRFKALSDCRQEAMYNASRLGFTNSEIGRAVNRTPSTVRDGVASYISRHEVAAE